MCSLQDFSGPFPSRHAQCKPSGGRAGRAADAELPEGRGSPGGASFAHHPECLCRGALRSVCALTPASVAHALTPALITAV